MFPGNNSGQGAAFPGRFQALFMKQHVPTRENFQQLTRSQGELRVDRTELRRSRTTEGAKYGHTTGSNPFEQVGQQGTVEVKNVKQQIEGSVRQKRLRLQVDESGVNIKSAFINLGLEQIKGNRGDVNCRHRKSPFGKINRIAAHAAGDIENPTRHQHGSDLLQPGICLSVSLRSFIPPALIPSLLNIVHGFSMVRP
ncbi:MAG TPA: hypothetical protein VJ995_07665, partial [Geothermobacteraceae bacterium]|nr:hypothetical protein [Geothermobacteraceae bacterium]